MAPQLWRPRDDARKRDEPKKKVSLFSGARLLREPSGVFRKWAGNLRVGGDIGEEAAKTLAEAKTSAEEGGRVAYGRKRPTRIGKRRPLSGRIEGEGGT
jgi:hypothetical protein